MIKIQVTADVDYKKDVS